MTIPAGSGSAVTNVGPYYVNAQATSSDLTLDSIGKTTGPAPPIYNISHNITSTQELLNGTVQNVPQQGSVAITNSSSVLLAGVAPSAFTYFTGITKGQKFKALLRDCMPC